ncbi:MAG: hypothetical protein V3U26_06140 [Dehalococcoidia bacterium]
MDNKASLEQRIGEEIDRGAFPRLATAWREFQTLLSPALPQEYLLLVKRDRLDLAVGTGDLLVILLVDLKHFLVTVAELDHVKGVDLGNHEESAKKGSEVQLSVWFLDNTRFYWESGPEDLERMREFALYVRRFLGHPLKPSLDSLEASSDKHGSG